MAVDDPASSEIIWRECECHSISRQHPNAKLPHFARNRRQDGVSIDQRDTKRRIAEQLRDRSFDFERDFFCHWVGSPGASRLPLRRSTNVR